MYGAFPRTVKGLAGMVYRRDPELEGVPAALENDLEDVDLAGSHLDVFSRMVFEDALEAGHAAILVDAPVSDQPVRDAASEKAAGLRPYWVHIRKDDILSWRTTRVNGAVVLDQVVIRETVYEPDGEYGETEVKRYKVYHRADPVTWEEYEERDGGEITAGATGVIKNVDEIPLAIAYGDRVAILESNPPLIDLAYTNVAHYQVQSDHLTALHKASVPIPVLIGVNPSAAIPVGPNVGIKLPEGGDFKYSEPTGAAFDATREQLTDFETQMAAQGLSFLQSDTRAAETAEAKRIDKAEQDSTLATAARSLQDALATALRFHAQMRGQGDNGGTVTINRDFERLTLDAQQVQAYSSLVATGQLSLDTLWLILGQGGVLPDEFDAELERANLDAELLAIGGGPPDTSDTADEEE
jgi:hypothetical protein